MSYPPGFLRSCHEADGRSDKSYGSGGTGSASGGGNSTRLCSSLYGDCKWSPAYNNPQSTQPTINSNISNNCAWEKWSTSFDALLTDGEGVALFKGYLDSEGCGNLLDFWFAVQGFRSKVDPSDRKKILQLIKAIYQTYIRGSSSTSSGRRSSNYVPVRLRTETRRAIADRLSHKSSLDQTVFDEAQNEVGQRLRTTAYQAFLKSDAFTNHIQQGGEYNPCQPSSYPNGGCYPPVPTSSQVYPGLLPTVDEDRELTGIEKPPLKGSVTPASCYYYFCGPPPAPTPLPSVTHCSCQRGPSYSQAGCFPQAAPLTQENIQITRFQRAELPVPQHLSSCPHCQTPFQPNSNPLSPAQHRQPIARFGGVVGGNMGPLQPMRRKCVDAVWWVPLLGLFGSAYSWELGRNEHRDRFSHAKSVCRCGGPTGLKKISFSCLFFIAFIYWRGVVTAPSAFVCCAGVPPSNATGTSP